ncbi:MAG: S1C family serine protease [Verrucomicrobiae bacterium]|nr:S1C family serine protease [Verrucomicrobiae bacterium]NNJ41902.1 serine protease [Akkermansiaceae bacterium]
MKKNLPELRVAVAMTMAVIGSLAPSLGAKVFPLNEKKVPESMEDLMAIQDALVGSLPRVRKATVSIKLGEGFGSGVIVSPEGLILTAAHVTAGVGKELTVILNDGTEHKALSMGLVSNTDAAMMRITEVGEYPYVEMNKENDYQLGHWIFALGHSGGFDKERGPVVRLGRIVKDSETTLQTDCKVIGGDSGGPLFDMEGQLIGIHSRVSKTMEQNMHVPMREYIKHWDEMEENKFLGDGPFAKRPVKGSGFLGFGSSDTEEGVIVGKVLEGGPADKAGIKTGDLVLGINEQKIADKAALKAILKEKTEGDELELSISRKGEELQIKVKLGKR